MKIMCVVVLILLLSGCSGVKYYFNSVPIYPEFEWVNPIIFQDNLNRCRHNVTCSVNDIF